METNIFDKFVSQKTLFKNKEHLRHNYRPAQLPHRQEEIEKISYNSGKPSRATSPMFP